MTVNFKERPADVGEVTEIELEDGRRFKFVVTHVVREPAAWHVEGYLQHKVRREPFAIRIDIPS